MKSQTRLHHTTTRNGNSQSGFQALCAHDITIAKVGSFQGDNVYALKKWSEENEQVE